MTLLPRYLPACPGAGSYGEPYASYTYLRAQDPIHWNEALGVFVVSRHADVLLTLRDRRWTSDFTGAGSPEGTARRRQPWQLLLFMDGPEHMRLRQIVGRTIAALLPTLREDVARFVGSALSSCRGRDDIDFVAEVAAPVATRVLARLIGAKDADLPRLTENAEALAGLIDWTVEPSGLYSVGERVAAFAPFLHGLVQEKRRRPGPDLVSALLEQARERAISYSDVVVTAILVLAAGHVTSTHMLCNGLLTLLQHPTVFDRLCAREVTAASVIEELLRFDPPVQATPRTALVDMHLGDTAVRRGDTVLSLLASANRDELVVSRPDVVDPARRGPASLSFGAGRHYCLGAELARATGATVLTSLCEYRAVIRLSDDQPSWRPTLTQHGLASLKIGMSG